jgi:hypothetical protein
MFQMTTETRSTNALKATQVQGACSGSGSHQPQEGGTQDGGGEPAQRALAPVSPLGHGHRLGLEEPLPSRHHPGPADVRFQLQLGGCKVLLLRSSFQRSLRGSERSPGPAPESLLRHRLRVRPQSGGEGPPREARCPCTLYLAKRMRGPLRKQGLSPIGAELQTGS